MTAAIAGCDVVVAPACVQTAPPFDDVDRPVAGVAATWPDVSARTMALWNVTGLPSVAVPIGFGDDGLPIGMQVAGAAFADERCLAVAAAFQGATDHHHRRPRRRGATMKHVYEFAEHDAGTNQGLLSQLVVPRPIAMVSTRDAEGIGNLSPFSYYLPITGEPPLVGVTFGMRSSDGLTKHSYDNLMASGDFVINVCTEMFAEHIEIIAKEYPAGDRRGRDARVHARRPRSGCRRRRWPRRSPTSSAGSTRRCRSAASRRPSCSSSPRSCAR